ncbi:MAG: MmcQ/YjbR family DNA-binding protein [Clostridia bacterium]|nr:MmcQ/YjbR family DNA-binding protein [Clostridia bacterium]
MRDLEYLLKKYTIDYNKLKKFGFIKKEDYYEYKEQIMKNEFEVQINIHNKKAFSKVVDIESGSEYVLVDVEDAVGEFIGSVRVKYDEIINRFVTACTHKEVFKSKQSKLLIKYIREKYGDELEFLWEKFDDNAIWRNKNSKKWYATLFCITADKLGLKDSKRIEVTNIMFQKDRVSEIINNKTIFPAYHMNKKSWVTIKLDDKVDMDEVYELIDNSYTLSGGKNDKK